MMGVLHPVGPEPASTYWARRALVLGALALLGVVIVALARLGDGRQQAVPAATPTTAAASVTPAVAGTSAVKSPSPEVTAAASSPASQPPATRRQPPAASRTPSAAAPAACRPGDLRVTLTGRQRLPAARPAAFDVAVINGSQTSCRVTVTGRNFELTVVSGRDRIWSSADCPRSVRAHNKVLAGEQALTWMQTWNGRRSAAGCRTRSEIPRPGTYYAIAQLDGSTRVQLRMILHG